MLKISVVLLLVVVACAIAFPNGQILDINGQEARFVADRGAYIIDRETPGNFRLQLVKITEATKSPSTGEVHMVVVMGETNCRKQQFTYEQAKQCFIRESSTAYRRCRINYEPKNKNRDYYVKFFCQ